MELEGKLANISPDGKRGKRIPLPIDTCNNRRVIGALLVFGGGLQCLAYSVGDNGGREVEEPPVR